MSLDKSKSLVETQVRIEGGQAREINHHSSIKAKENEYQQFCEPGKGKRKRCELFSTPGNDDKKWQKMMAKVILLSMGRRFCENLQTNVCEWETGGKHVHSNEKLHKVF